MTYPARHARKGFTLTELAIAIGVIGVLLGSIWAGADMVQENRKVSRAVAQILEINTNIKAMLAMQPGFNTTSLQNYTPKMIAANIFPGDMPPNVGSNNNNVRNPWGGGTIVYANANAAFPNTFRISYYGIPASACTKIAAGVISKSNSFDADPVAFVTHGGQNGPNSTPNLTTTAVDATSIAVSCGFNTEANDATNSIEFDFKMTR